MDLVQTFINQVISTVPTAVKVAKVKKEIKKYLRELERDVEFSNKLCAILQLFIRKSIGVNEVYDIMQAANGLKLSHNQVNYFCFRTHSNAYILNVLQNFVRYRELKNHEIDELSHFLVEEINNAIIYEK
jgi:Protein of unknown function (DUF1160)